MNKFIDTVKGLLPIILGVVTVLAIIGLFLGLSDYETRQATSGICTAAFFAVIVIGVLMGIRRYLQNRRVRQARQEQQRSKSDWIAQLQSKESKSDEE